MTFLEQEFVTDLSQGERREIDLVARVPKRNGELEMILIHVELESRREPDFPQRMFAYYVLLRRRHRLPVLPIVVYVTGGKGHGQWEWYREDVLSESVLTFRYRRLRLKAFNALEAAQSDDPLVCALAVLMDRRGADPAVLKAASLQGVGRSSLDEARQWMLANIVDSYLPLTGAALRRYEQLLVREEYQMAGRLDYYAWRDQMRNEGREEGTIQAKQEDIVAVLRARFTPIPDELAQRIRAIAAPEALNALLIRAATATSLDEVRAALPN